MGRTVVRTERRRQPAIGSLPFGVALASTLDAKAAPAAAAEAKPLGAVNATPAIITQAPPVDADAVARARLCKGCPLCN